MTAYMKKEHYDEIQFITFPLFKEFRKTNHFKTAFRELYRKEFNEGKLITKLGKQIRKIQKI
jgi:hypothetical protein